MIHKRWLYFTLAVLCAVIGGLLFAFEQAIAGTCILLLTGVACIAFVVSPDEGERQARPQSVFVIQNPHMAPEIVVHQPQPLSIEYPLSRE
jgi:hypothetical protein